MTTFYQYLLKLEAGPPPTPSPGGNTPPSAGGSTPPGSPSPTPPPGGDPLGGGLGGAGAGGGGLGGGLGGPPGGDPMGGAGGGAPMTRKAINITTWEDALKLALGKSADRPPEPMPIHNQHRSNNKKEKPLKSLSQ
jgi:hypothetical protein